MSAPFYPQVPAIGAPGASPGGTGSRTQPAYKFWSLSLAALISANSPARMQFTGDVFAVHNFVNPPMAPDLWFRLDGGDWVRLLPGTVWEQPYKLVEIYVGTAVVGGVLELVLQQNGLYD